MLEVKARIVLEGLRLGDSVAVNGVCLTVTGVGAGWFQADVMHETLDRTAFSALRTGSPVNLERAMAADGRFGGHLVAGHVDGTGVLTQVRRDDTAVWYTVQASPSLLRYVVEKGSIALDGISLTVAAVTPETFSVSVIPHTARATALGTKGPGDPVNLETDLIGKYVEKLLGPLRPEGPEGGGTAWKPESGRGRKSDGGMSREPEGGTGRKSGVTRDLLARNGFC